MLEKPSIQTYRGNCRGDNGLVRSISRQPKQCRNAFVSRRLRDCTPSPLKEVMIQSDLHGDMQSAAEMTAPPFNGGNSVQISSKEIVVTGTQLASKHAGLRNMLAYQVMKAGKELKRKQHCATVH